MRPRKRRRNNDGSLHHLLRYGLGRRLRRPTRGYQKLRAWAHITESTWAVLTEYNAQMIANHLTEYLPDGSRLFVVRSGDEAAWQYLNCASDEWLEAILSQDVIRINKLHSILHLDS